MVKVRVAVLLVVCLLLGGLSAAQQVTFNGSVNPSVIPDLTAYRMVFIDWGQHTHDTTELTNRLENLGFSATDAGIIVSQMQTFQTVFYQYTETADQDPYVSQTEAALQAALSPAGVQTLSNFVTGEKSSMQIDTWTGAPLSPTTGASTGVTSYFTSADGGESDLALASSIEYGDTYSIGLIHCRDIIQSTVMTLDTGGTVAGSIVNNVGTVRGHQKAFAGAITSTGYVLSHYLLNYGPVQCGSPQLITVKDIIDIEYAYTRVRNIQGVGSGPFTQLGGGTYYTWQVIPACINVPVWAFPDWDPTTMDDNPLAPNPWGWDTEATCERDAIHHKWECVDSIFFPAVRYNTNVGPKNCTYNP